MNQAIHIIGYYSIIMKQFFSKYFVEFYTNKITINVSIFKK